MQKKNIKEIFYDLKANPCKSLLKEIRNCKECSKNLPLGPRPILNFHKESKILLAGQAPGTRVHESGIPWDDASGKRLREWMNVSDEIFYDVLNFAIVPMGYCYPGKVKTGDLPPREECAELWLDEILNQLENLELVIAVGKYAQNYYINNPKLNTTELCKRWGEFNFSHKGKKITILALPHPSPRNNIWLKKNPWFEEEIIPKLQSKVKDILVRETKSNIFTNLKDMP